MHPMLQGSRLHSLVTLIVVLHMAGSLLTFVAFGVDKRRARKNERRVPERTLHTLTVCFGAAGAILAMVLLRHKTRKPSFFLVTGLVAIGHVALVGLGTRFL